MAELQNKEIWNCLDIFTAETMTSEDRGTENCQWQAMWYGRRVVDDSTYTQPNKHSTKN